MCVCVGVCICTMCMCTCIVFVIVGSVGMCVYRGHSPHFPSGHIIQMHVGIWGFCVSFPSPR